MRPQQTMLVIGALLLVCIAITGSVAVDSNMNELNPSPLTVEGTSKQRMLRRFPTTEDNDDERVFPGLSKVAHAENLKLWLSNGASVDDVLKKLRLGEGADVITNPNIKFLDDYVEMLNKKYPDNQVSLVDMLSARYGDDVVANALITASKVEQTEDIAAKLQVQQLLSWLDRGISTDDVAKKLKISEEGAQFVSSPKLSTLSQYMLLASATNPQANLNYVAILRNAFGGDKNFATAVMNAVGSRSDTALYLRNAFGDDKNFATAVMSAVGSGSDTALLFQKELYKDWFNRKIIPSKTLKTIFGTYRREEKLFVSKYKKYYDAKMKSNE